MLIALFLFLFMFLTIIGPLYLYLTGVIDLSANYRTAKRDSAEIAPNPDETHEAIIQVYAARTFNWRGYFAVHTWVAVKLPGAKTYLVHQKIGWRLFYKLPPVVTDEDVPDRYWFNQKPSVILDIRGDAAEKLIEKIKVAVESYPFADHYHYWPGPNSNTFIAHIGRETPELHLVMPSIAMGKDYLRKNKIFARAVSGSGFQISIKGVLGITIALREGLEINILGLVYGISPWMLSIKLPGIGDIGLKKLNIKRNT